MDITTSTVFIPGATSGIGLGLARRLADAGSTVVVGGRRRALLDEITAADPRLDAVVVDVDDPDSITAAVHTVVSRHPTLDAVVTMSGIMRPEDLRDPGHLAAAEATITTNLLGTIRLVDAVLPQLLSRPRATLMTVSSGLAFTPLAAAPTYSATKAAVHSYTLALRTQLAGSAVEVLELVPPAVATDILGGADFGGMPLEAFLDEVVTLLRADTGEGVGVGVGPEVLVQNVLPLRWAERDGKQEELIRALAGGH